MSALMTRAQVQDLLPEYLAGELDALTRERFETSLAQHADLAAEARSLCAAVDALRSIDAKPSRAVPVRSIRPNFAWAVLRYAAVVALAFTIGFVVRGTAIMPSEPVQSLALTEIESADRAAPRTAVEQRLIDGYTRAGGAGTSLGRSLIALAHAADTTHR